MDELSRNLNATMLSTHLVDEEKTRAIDEMQQYVSIMCIHYLRRPRLVSVGWTFGIFCLSVCLFVCLSVCLQHNSKTNYHKVFRLGVGNDLGDIKQLLWFWVERSKVRVRMQTHAEHSITWNM